MDAVDKIIAQWKTERPDLDTRSMGLIGRMKRLSTHVTQSMEKTLLRHGLTLPGFDVLATLRRSGPPFQLSPGDLLATMMIASGTMTNRIDQLEKTGLIERIKNPDDGRSVLIKLTDKGLQVIEAAVTDHVKTLNKLTSNLSGDDFQALDTLLAKFLRDFE